MKPVIILFSKWDIFSDANPHYSIDGRTKNSPADFADERRKKSVPTKSGLSAGEMRKQNHT